MRIIPQEKIELVEIIERLKLGDTIVYPTETCYGLGCDALNARAVEKIFQIKDRDPKKPMLVIVHDISVIKDYLEWTPTMDQLAKKYWPGALTLVVPVVGHHPFPPGIVSDTGTVAFRVTSHPFAYSLAAALNRPLVSTSANLSTLASPYDIEAVRTMFVEHQPQPDIIIDAGTLPEQSPSTIARVVDDTIVIARQGDVVIDVEEFNIV